MIEKMRQLFLAIAVLACGSASSQTFEETVAAAQAAVGDIARYQEALQNPDPRFQYAMVQQMLKNPDPALQRIAKEHALFSTNPVMREAAIKAIFDAGTTLRLEFAGSGTSYEWFPSIISKGGGVFSQNTGQLLTAVPPALNDACWGTRDTCAFRQVGNAVQVNYDQGNNFAFNANLVLGTDGVLRGTAKHSRGETLQMQIDLKQ
ncbi:MAG: hypothetical protein AAFQ54_02000 [Pseudomonadota bacterium]